jgi:hypothetical protein
MKHFVASLAVSVGLGLPLLAGCSSATSDEPIAAEGVDGNEAEETGEVDSEVKAAKKKPVSCPTFPPPAPSFCAGGKIVQVKGANGCSAPSCVMPPPPPPPPTCPQVAAPAPGFCPGGTVTLRYDASTGCHIGFDCTPAPTNACTAAGGTCVGLAPSSCATGNWGSAATHSCGGGIGVGCCLP